MYSQKGFIVLLISLGFIIGIWCMPRDTSDLLDSNSNSLHRNNYGEEVNDPKIIPKIAAGDNYQIIEDIFSAKLNEYSTNGFFNQMYEPSLQATYYALYILKALEKLDTVDNTTITNYIMSHYNTTTHIFTDNYAYRYLDTDDNIAYYPFSTLLEVNCYAILSLDILNQLGQIPTAQDSINFILSCYNPTSYAFIGQPYDTCPSGMLKIPTMDNTYYAIVALKTLGVDLGSKENEITDFINDLQNPVWGFANDMDLNFKSLGLTMWEPNLLSAYYCIKSLGLFGYEASINTVNFHQYLQTLYDDQNFIFQMGSFYTPDKDNIVASTLGVQLSDLTPIDNEYFLDSGNRSGVINFILTNRNSMGNWDSSTPYDYHELIDTFQIVRGLNETGAISQLTTTEKDEIANALSYYNNSGGYCLISNDYVSVEQYYNVINSFYLYDRIADIDLQGVYDILRGTCLYESNFEIYYFYACTNMPLQELTAGRPTIPGGGFRSYPIEYFTSGKREYLKEWNRINDHKAKYQVLDTLRKVFKLDDLEQDRDLSNMLDDVVNSQFLESEYSNYGAFLPSIILSTLHPSHQNSEMIFEHSDYAIKCMEFISDYLSLGSITDLNFDENHLYNYIIKNIEDDGTYLHFNPQYTSNIETIIENTYYMIYVLNAIDMYALDNNKIENFILQNLNYSNIKNIYYSYKISEILNLDLSFDVDLTHSLVHAIYSEELNEFYLTTDRKSIEQQVFLWICDMAKNDKVRISSEYSDNVMLGDYNHVNASLCNIILKDFGPYTTVKLESPQIGTIILDQQANNSFQKEIFIPVSPNNYPMVRGNITLYDGPNFIEELPIVFQTYYDLTIAHKVSKGSNNANIEINVSLISGLGEQPLYDCYAYADIYKNGNLLETKNFLVEHIDYSFLTLNYTFESVGNYSLKFYLENPYELDSMLINETQFTVADIEYLNPMIDSSDSDKSSSRVTLKTDYQNAIPLMIAIISIPSCVIGISTKLKRKSIINSKSK